MDPDTLAKIQETFSAGYAGDEEGAEEIRARFEQDHYLCDTHTAVAFRVAETCRSGAPMVVLSTASPFKFPAGGSGGTGGASVPESDFDAMAALTANTGEPAPESLQELNRLPVRLYPRSLRRRISVPRRCAEAVRRQGRETEGAVWRYLL